MVTGIYTKSDMTFLGAKEVDYTNRAGKHVQGVTLSFEDSNGVEGSYYVSKDMLDAVSYPDRRCEGTLYVKVSEGTYNGNRYTKVDFKKFIEI